MELEGISGRIWPKLITLQMKKLTPAAAQDAELPAKPGLGGQVLALRSSSIFPQASDLPSSTFEIWTLCLFVSGFSDGILKVYLLLKMSGTLAGDKKKKKRKCQRERPTCETRNSRGAGRHRKQQPVSSAALHVINKLNNQRYEPRKLRAGLSWAQGKPETHSSFLHPNAQKGNQQTSLVRTG